MSFDPGNNAREGKGFMQNTDSERTGGSSEHSKDTTDSHVVARALDSSPALSFTLLVTLGKSLLQSGVIVKMP